MIDFIRLRDSRNSRNFTLHNDQEIYDKFNSTTGVIREKPYCFDNNLKINLNYIEGSIHKYFNNLLGRAHLANSNDFNFENINYIIDYLMDKYNIQEKQAEITAFEFGFNLDINIFPKSLIVRNVKLFKNRLPSDREDKPTDIHKFFKMDNYIVKIYDKGAQLRLKTNKLRVEIRYKKDEFNKFGIKYIEDLKSMDFLKLAYEDFKKKIDQLVIIDDLNNSVLHKDIKCMLSDLYSNNFSSAKNKSRMSIKLKKMIEELSLNTIKVYLQDKINKKYKDLTDVHFSYYRKYGMDNNVEYV